MARIRNGEREYRQMVDEEFRRLAPIYDGFALFVRGMRRRAAAMAQVPDAGRVLDVATGTGEQALAFARVGHRVDALDLSEDMLAVARRKDREGRVRWHHGDATQLPFADDTFALTTVSLALHDMPRPV
ncbi:MAG TPA: methyltransferase domain-containing protein, partial [Bacillota bacterium]